MRNTPSVLFITLSALRQDHLGCYGYKKNTSPHIDQISREGIMFTQAISQATWSLPSVSSVLTSTYPMYHNATYFGDTLNNSLLTLPQILGGKNYSTGFIGPYALSKIKGLNRGFEFFNTGIKDFKELFSSFYRHFAVINIITKFILYSLPFGFDCLANVYTGIINNERADIVTQKAIRWLKVNKDKPFFLWLHYFDAHGPYRPLSPYNKMFINDRFEQKTNSSLPIFRKGMLGLGGISRYYMIDSSINDRNFYVSQYDGAIRFIDDNIGNLLLFLKKLKLEDDTLIIIFSDHGEYLGEHKFYFCHTGISFEPLIRVPLIIKYNKITPKRKSIDSQVQLIDIAPTALDILNIERPKTFQGNSLLPLILEGKEYNAPYAIICDNGAVTIRTPDYKLMHFNYDEIKRFESKMRFGWRSSVTLQLEYLFGSNKCPEYLFFDLKGDPGETNDLAYAEKEKMETIKKVILDFVNHLPPAGNIKK